MSVAAIDMGSNAIRVSIASKPAGKFHVVEELLFKKRFPCRLGSDVFKGNTISFEKKQQLDFIFQEIRQILNSHEVTQVKCVGTSAFRDSENGKEVLANISKKYSIPIEIISGQEEALLMSQGLERRDLFVEKAPHLHADIGGGSLELSLYYKGKFLFQNSIDVGTLRLIGEVRSGQLVQDYSKSLNLINEILNKDKIQELRVRYGDEISLHGTGGNFRRLGRLRKYTFGRRKECVLEEDEVASLIGVFMNYNGFELAQHYPVREENAALLVPSLLIIQRILQFWPALRINIPKISLTHSLLDGFVGSQKSSTT